MPTLLVFARFREQGLVVGQISFQFGQVVARYELAELLVLLQKLATLENEPLAHVASKRKADKRS